MKVTVNAYQTSCTCYVSKAGLHFQLLRQLRNECNLLDCEPLDLVNERCVNSSLLWFVHRGYDPQFCAIFSTFADVGIHTTYEDFERMWHERVVLSNKPPTLVKHRKSGKPSSMHRFLVWQAFRELLNIEYDVGEECSIPYVVHRPFGYSEDQTRDDSSPFDVPVPNDTSEEVNTATSSTLPVSLPTANPSSIISLRLSATIVSKPSDKLYRYLSSSIRQSTLFYFNRPLMRDRVASLYLSESGACNLDATNAFRRYPRLVVTSNISYVNNARRTFLFVHHDDSAQFRGMKKCLYSSDHLEHWLNYNTTTFNDTEDYDNVVTLGPEVWIDHG